MASSGHLRRCSDADTTQKSLNRAKDDSVVSWPTIMESSAGAGGHLRWPHQVTNDDVATPIRPKTLEPCERCLYTITANYNGLLEAVDCHIHSRYDMVTYDDVATPIQPSST
eukprot:scaffold22769_cov98-Skeletonema_dohrnii-CCMP3373.AAC.1